MILTRVVLVLLSAAGPPASGGAGGPPAATKSPATPPPPPPPPVPAPLPPASPDGDSLDRAKTLNREGKAKLDAEDFAGALEAFRQSYELVPSYQNTRNMALCLVRLRRHDEAYARYEEVLERFAAELPADTRADTEASLAELRLRTGGINVLSGGGGVLSVDGAARGALPLKKPLFLLPGSHEVRVDIRNEAAFVRRVEVTAGTTIVIEVPAAPARAAPVEPALNRPPARPLADRLHGFFAEVFGGIAVGPSLSSDAEHLARATCAADCPSATGPFLGLRLGRRFEGGLALELGGGYLGLESNFSRPLTAFLVPEGAPLNASYEVQDHLTFRGGWTGAGASYRFRLSGRFAFVPRLTVAGLFARVQDAASATGAADGVAAAAAVVGSNEARISSGLFVLPELGMQVSLGPVHLGASMMLGFAPQGGPRFGQRTLRFPAGGAPCASGRELSCVSPTFAGGRAHGPFFVAIPGLSLGVEL